ncbi:hypothetical protein QTN25_001985 [Entamoeba marina]
MTTTQKLNKQFENKFKKQIKQLPTLFIAPIQSSSMRVYGKLSDSNDTHNDLSVVGCGVVLCFSNATFSIVTEEIEFENNRGKILLKKITDYLKEEVSQCVEIKDIARLLTRCALVGQLGLMEQKCIGKCSLILTGTVKAIRGETFTVFLQIGKADFFCFSDDHTDILSAKTVGGYLSNDGLSLENSIIHGIHTGMNDSFMLFTQSSKKSSVCTCNFHQLKTYNSPVQILNTVCGDYSFKGSCCVFPSIKSTFETQIPSQTVRKHSRNSSDVVKQSPRQFEPKCSPRTLSKTPTLSPLRGINTNCNLFSNSITSDGSLLSPRFEPKMNQPLRKHIF